MCVFAGETIVLLHGYTSHKYFWVDLLRHLQGPYRIVSELFDCMFWLGQLTAGGGVEDCPRSSWTW
jgi:hypothetical protein